ncbi:hypothetical protein B0H16DRAFT_1601650 [Mycena metata]|uniref:DUF5648 domain-containing protein n=1 Tax=Mycena metata TaxID=1033252 RepID=A0AAD7MLN6_9AGAR|nr:hypothetical protein B0H16DRAFT_1601650 [Mycena metata]
MRRLVLFFALVATLTTLVHGDSCAPPSQAIPVYRSFNNGAGDHFYTTNTAEYNTATASGGYFAEGARFAVFPTASATNTVQFIRLFNGGVTDHFYTTNQTEANNAAAGGGYTIENLSPMYIYSTQLCGSVPLYRSYSANATDHFYTTSMEEQNGMLGYKFELIAGYVLSLNASEPSNGSTSAGSTFAGSPSNTVAPPSNTANAALRVFPAVPRLSIAQFLLTLGAALLL